MSPAPEPIAVIGTGYVGLVTAAGFAELGSEVFCVDVDAAKIAMLRDGRVPIYEPGLAEVVGDHRDRLHFSTDLAPALEAARLLFVCVGTPPTYSGDADLSAVHAVIDAMPASDRHALVMKSTVPPGTGTATKRILTQQGKGLAYVSCPEFLREGSAIEDFRHPDRVVVGDDRDWAGDAVVALYEPLQAPLVRTDVVSAEMVKLATNAFLSTKISFINEIANVCEETGADVLEVARGMGLDHRVGSAFLRPGIGFGGSCLAGEETVLVRRHGRTTLLRLEHVWRNSAGGAADGGAVEPEDVEVLSWAPGGRAPRFMPVMTVTRRRHQGEMLEIATKMGRRIRCTPDHPWVVADGETGKPRIKLARDLTCEDWVPLAGARSEWLDEARLTSLVGAVEAAGLAPDDVLARAAPSRVAALVSRPIVERRRIFARAGSAAARTGEVKRTGTARLDELALAGVPSEGLALGTASNGNFVPSEMAIDEAFWRVVGLYLAEGHVGTEASSARRRLTWSFHPHREEHLVDEVSAFWLRWGVAPRTCTTPTARSVAVASRLLGAWWTEVLGLGANSYQQRLPDLIWDRPDREKWALLSGLWEGDGSWSLVNGGPSVILELGTVSDELADGVLRLLGDLAIVASRRIGRTAKSTKDTHWLRISGADQVERAIDLVPSRDRAGVETSIARLSARIAPTGSRERNGSRWVRVTSIEAKQFDGPVFSLEVPGAHTFVTTGGLVVHNCFPKDISALKQLAGNSGYHFQLLNAVIEVNELQKRRVVAKLHKHLGDLVGRRVALLGLAFKPHTDDMREASSLVLAARLQSEGAHVTAYDPIAEPQARELMPGVSFATAALEALEGADACVLVTEWPELVELDWRAGASAMAGRLVVDGRNALDPAAVRAAGLTYEGIGRR